MHDSAFHDAQHRPDVVQRDGADVAVRLAGEIAALLGPTARAIVHYGSRAQGRASREDSAFDFFVLVDRYGDAFRALAHELGWRSRVGFAIALAWLLPPNAISIRRTGPDGWLEAKCLIISARHFRRECSARARDHFVRGRLMQHVLLVWSRNHDTAAEVRRGLDEVQRGSFAWIRPYLPPRFDTARYCRTLLIVSLSHEVRLEAADHAETLFTAQRDRLLKIYDPLLSRLEAQGDLLREGSSYQQSRAPSPMARARVRAWFAWSKFRTTARLLKHPFLYDDWLEYLIKKISRSTGERIELTERERRRPLLFLWPRALRYLRRRPQLGRKS